MAKALNYRKNSAYKLHKVAAALVLASDRLLEEELRLSFSQFLILMALDESPRANQREVTEYVGISPGATSYQVEILKRDGLVEAAENSRSRRENVLKLTAKGKRVAAEAFELLDEHYKRLFEAVEWGDRKEFGRALDKLVKRVEHE